MATMVRKACVLLLCTLVAGTGRQGNVRRHAPENEAGRTSDLQTATRSLTALTREYPYYHTTEEISAKAKELAERCGAPASFRTASENGVSIDVIRVQSSSKKPRNKVLILFGEHSRELIGPESGLGLLEALCSDKPSEQVKAALQDSEFELILNGNPRSRRKVEAGDYCIRTNPSGVDLNRNWDEEWQKESVAHGSDSNPGPSPFSEPETRLFRSIASDFAPQTFLTVHSGTLGLYMPWAYDMEHLASRNQRKMMGVLKGLDEKHCRCPFGAAGKEVGYSCPGTSLDWIYDKLNTSYSFAFEIFVGADLMRSLRARWQEHSQDAEALLQAGDHLAHPNTKHFFQAHPSDFVQLRQRKLKQTASQCFEQYNPSNEELYKSTVGNWVSAYLEMAVKIADNIRAEEGRQG
mmetsp:Transcript_34955/g.80498  ORF Transcript_34955/g.80498 Transcript_34955/m.80498 type:complete len:408 (+) Transcript_34955:80-1303(+)